MNLVTILVPIYKPTLSNEEVSSLRQLVGVLGRYKITFVTFKALNVEAYKKVIGSQDVNIAYFDQKFFGNVWAYNKLLTSKSFYSRFLNSKYVLIYQLDAWIFKDELNEWCERGFDYIGAPWYEGYGEAEVGAAFLGVGNGGFSLRKIESHLKVLNSFSFIYPFNEFKKLRYGNSDPTSKQFLKLKIDHLLINNSHYLFNQFNENEDTFWGKLMPQKFSWFKVPDELTAARFAMEVNAPQLYKRLGQVLPFGCHAWEKYSPSFWSQFISLNNNVVEQST